GLENREPDSFAAPFGSVQGGEYREGFEVGETGVASAEPGVKVNEGVQASTASSRAGEGFHEVGKMLQRGILVHLGREERQDEFSSRVHASRLQHGLAGGHSSGNPRGGHSSSSGRPAQPQSSPEYGQSRISRRFIQKAPEAKGEDSSRPK